MTTLCLTMIVKNESRIIERCLESVRSICDYMTICDTGSTDETREIVRAFLDKHQIKGQVFEHTWENFGHNRSLSMQVARETGADYILTIDADMVAEITDFDKSQLTLDSYGAVQRLGSLYYTNTRFMKASREWQCVGVTHEYWDCSGFRKKGDIKGFVINDLGDGGSKAEKFERDIRLLEQGVIDEPKNERYYFYLAQSYKDTGQYALAIEWYQKRIDAGGWNQEVWYSKYIIGECWQKLGDWPKALDVYLDAFDYLPERAEPLYKIVRHYRDNGKNILAYEMCQKALEIPFPPGSPLFCSTDVYVSKLYYEMSIVAFYVKKNFRGLLACEKLLHAPPGSRTACLPWSEFAGSSGRIDQMSSCLSNRLFYVIPLVSEKRQISIGGLEENWSICNPFLATIGDEVLLLIRSVNYKLVNGKYEYPFGKVNTKTYYTTLKTLENLEFEKLSHIQEIPETIVPQKFPSQVQDYEDVRAIQCKGVWYGIATSREMNAETRPELVLLRFSNGPGEIESVVRLRGHEDEKTQKNWMPFIWEDTIHFVYMCEPLTILKLADPSTGRVEVVQKTPNALWHMGHYRGGTPGIPFGDGFLFLIHEVVHGSNSRTYTHRFIQMSKQWEISRISHPFYFQHKGVEFVTGMAVMGETLCIGVGIKDCEAWVHQVALNDVNRWLTHGALLLR